MVGRIDMAIVSGTVRMGRFAIAVGGLLLVAGACAHPSDSSAPNEGALSYKLVESLTTEVGPRLAGTPAEAAGRDWAVRTFDELGFANVRIEPFTIKGWVRGLESAEIVAPTRQRLVVTTLGGSVATPSNGIAAPVAFVASYEDLLAAKPGAFGGKIVFVNDRMQRARDGSGYGKAVRKRSKGAIEAARRGALAVVIRSVGTDSTRFAHTGNMNYEDGVRRIPAAAVSAPDADQIERLHQEGAPIQLKLMLRPRHVASAPSGNVIAEIVGRERPEEIVLLGAHLDSWDLGTGAIDDAAGVGIVIAAALRAAGPDGQAKRTIRVVLFGSEEVGVHGGKAYAEAHADEAGRHILAMESDFGTGSAWRFTTRVPESDLPFFDAVAAQLSPLGIERGDNKASGGADISAMRKLGVPVASVGQDGTTYFDLHHTANDTFDKIDPDALEQVREAVARVAAAAANR